MEQNMQNSYLSPQSNSFYFFCVSPVFILLGIIFGVICLIADMSIALSVSSLFSIALAGVFWWTYISLKKEKYEFLEDRIIFHRGSPISSESTEIEFNKITKITLRRGFFQNLFFKTGDILIATGGMGSVKLTDLENPQQYFDYLQQGMKKNGFHLQMDQLVQEVKPHLLAIFMEISSRMISLISAVVYIVLNVSDSDIFFKEMSGISIIILIIIILIAILQYLIVEFLDLQRRKYKVFTDAIVYEEGFLTKYYTILPMEKVSDTENEQGFFAKIFGLHDVKVSSEGGGNQVLFKNMIDGELMLKNIRFLKDAISLQDVKPVHGIDSSTQEEVTLYKNIVDTPFQYNQEFIAEFSPNFTRSLFGMIAIIIFWCLLFFGMFVTIGDVMMIGYFFPVVLLTIFSYLRQIISVFFTKFSITSSTIEFRFSFLSNTHLSFSVDKITRVDFLRNPIDLLLGTTSIVFSSIGSNKKIIFRFIRISDEDKQKILEKVGIYSSELFTNIYADFSLMRFLQANIFLLPLLPFFVIAFLVQNIFYSSRFYENRIYNTFIQTRRNIIFWAESYVRLENIKKLNAVKYIGTTTGSLHFSIAQNVSIVDDNQQQAGSHSFSNLIQSGITFEYVENVFDFLDAMDEKRSGIQMSHHSIEEDGRSVKNSLMPVFILSIPLLVIAIFGIMQGDAEMLFFGISIILVFSIIVGCIVWNIKKYRYIIKNERIELWSGIFYQSRKTILYSQMNATEISQGVIGKICRNGDIRIFTLGGSYYDLEILASQKYKELHTHIKQRLGK